VLAAAGQEERRRVRQQLHELLLAELHAAGELDWSRAVIDSSHVRAARAAPQAGNNPDCRSLPTATLFLNACVLNVWQRPG
jgi:hypothetical protein